MSTQYTVHLQPSVYARLTWYALGDLMHGCFRLDPQYAEAAVFRTFLQEGRLALSSELPLTDPEE